MIVKGTIFVFITKFIGRRCYY